MNQRLVVFCRVPGRWRAGMQHPQMAEYALDHFTAGQLAEIRQDGAFSLAIGEMATGAMVDQLIGAAFKREHVAAIKEAALASGPVAAVSEPVPPKKAKGSGA